MNNLTTISRIGGTSSGTLPPLRLPSAAAHHQALLGALLVIGGEMGISHRHLCRPAAHELSDNEQTTPAITSLEANVCRLQCQV
jgi:hypothetical protein